MLLAVDVGNTNMVFSLFAENTLCGTFRLRTDLNRTSDEIGLLTCDYFRRFGFDVGGVTDVIVASVVPPVMHSLNNAIYKYFGKTPIIVGETVDAGLTYAVQSEERLGADRAVACVAAVTKYGAPLIVLDFGTATTVDAIDKDGKYLGGCITAGIRIATEALFSKTAMLPRVELQHPGKFIGTTTVEQIQAGTVGGYIGAIEYLVRSIRAEMGGGTIKAVATGGLARMATETGKVVDITDPNLISEGLRIIYERYAAAKTDGRPLQNASGVSSRPAQIAISSQFGLIERESGGSPPPFHTIPPVIAAHGSILKQSDGP